MQPYSTPALRERLFGSKSILEFGKALRVGQGQDKSERGDRADAEDTPQGSEVGILFLRYGANLYFVILDLLGELPNLLDDRPERDLHLGRQLFPAAHGKSVGIATRDAI